MEKVYMQVFTVSFVITAALWPSFALTVVESIETMHDALPFPASEFQAPVFFNFLSFSAFSRKY